MGKALSGELSLYADSFVGNVVRYLCRFGLLGDLCIFRIILPYDSNSHLYVSNLYQLHLYVYIHT